MMRLSITKLTLTILALGVLHVPFTWSLDVAEVVDVNWFDKAAAWARTDDRDRTGTAAMVVYLAEAALPLNDDYAGVLHPDPTGAFDGDNTEYWTKAGFSGPRFSDDRPPRLVDLNGDGLRELVAMLDEEATAVQPGTPGPHGVGFAVDWVDDILAEPDVERDSFQFDVADVSGDGIVDLVVLVESGTGAMSVRWHENTANGGGLVIAASTISLTDGTELVATSSPASIVQFHMGDCDGDGLADTFVLFDSGAATTLEVVRTATAPARSVLLTATLTSFWFEQHSGLANLIAIDRATGTLTHLVHTPGSDCEYTTRGSTVIADFPTDSSTSVTPRAMLADADFDGDLDFVAVGSGSLVASLYSRDSETFGANETLVDSLHRTRGVMQVDTFGRGLGELGLIYASGNVASYVPDQLRAIDVVAKERLMTTTTEPVSALFARLRDSAVAELVLVSGAFDEASGKLSVSRGTVTRSGESGVASLTSYGASIAAVADLDGDGFDEVVIATEGAAGTTTEIYVWVPNTSTGVLTAPSGPVTVAFAHTVTKVFAKFELTGDAHPDLLLVSAGQMAIFAGDGAGSFASTPTSNIAAADADANTVVVGDLFGQDGLNDIVVVSEPASLTVYTRATSLGAWNSVTHSIADADIDNISGAEAVDYDGDFDLDIILGNGRPPFGCSGSPCDIPNQNAYLLENNGDGSGFTFHNLGQSPAPAAFVDMDGDGRIELVGGGTVLRSQLRSASFEDSDVLTYTTTLTETEVDTSVAISPEPGHTVLVTFVDGDGVFVEHLYTMAPREVRVDPDSGSDVHCVRDSAVACATVATALSDHFRYAAGSALVVVLSGATHVVTAPLVIARFSHRNLIFHVDGDAATIDCQIDDSTATCLSIVSSSLDAVESQAQVRFTGGQLHVTSSTKNVGQLVRVNTVPWLIMGRAPWAQPCEGYLPCGYSPSDVVHRPLASWSTEPHVAFSGALTGGLRVSSVTARLELHNLELYDIAGTAALHVEQSANVNLAHSTVRNNTCIGLLAEGVTDNFVVRELTALGNSVSSGSGGAGMLLRSSVARITDSLFTANSVSQPATFGGAGLLLESDSSVQVSDTYFVGNRVSGVGLCGGAVALNNLGISGTELVANTFTQTQFVSNAAVNKAIGGALCALLSTAEVQLSHFTMNTATEGGAIVGSGLARIVVRNSTLVSNSAVDSGGAVLQDSGRFEVMNSGFVDNYAGTSGGAISVRIGTLVANRVNISGCTAGEHGGAVACEGTATSDEFGSMVIADSTLLGNRAEEDGGALWVSTCTTEASDTSFADNTATQDGGAVWVSTTTASKVLSASDCVFARNQAAQGNGGCVYADSPDADDAVHLVSGLGVVFDSCAAPLGGGGAVFVVDSTNVSVPSESGFSGNSAGYGPIQATNPTQLAVLQETVSLVPHEPRDPLAGTLRVGLLDALDQIVAVDSSSYARVSSDATAVGTVQLTLSSGQASFGGMFGLEAAPGQTHSLRFEAFVGSSLLTTAAVSVELSPCQPGTAVEDGVRCTECPIGSFTDGENAPSCSLCPKNSYGTAIGQDSCTPCNNGSVTQGEGSNSCSRCPAGQFHDVSNGTCESCAVNSYTSRSGQTLCTACTDGSTTLGLTGSVTCVQCSPGTFHNTTLGVCVSCPAGSYSDLSGAVACTLCPAGNTTSRAGSQYCPPCSAGTVQPLKGQTSCNVCPEHTIADDVGLTTCTACPAPSFASGTANRRCQRCSADQYASFVNGTFQVCFECPASSLCDSETGEVTAVDGYWLDLNPITGAYASFECPEGTACKSGECGDGRKPASENPLCSECEDGLYEWGGECIECQGTQWLLVVAFFAITFVFVLVLHIVVDQSKSGELPVLLYLVQMTLLFAGHENGVVLYVLEVFNFNFVEASGTTCLAPLSPKEKLTTVLAAPGVAYFMWVVLALVFKARASATNVTFHRGPLLRTLLMLYLFLYNTTSGNFFSYLNCVDITVSGENARVIQAYPSISCESEYYERGLPFVLCGMLLIVVVMPALVFYGLWRTRTATSTRSLSKYSTIFSAISSYYKPRTYWWQLYSILRRTILVGMFVVFATDKVMRLVVVTLFNLLFLVIHMWMRPFRRKIDNTVETVSLLLLAVLTTALQALNPAEDSSDDWVIFAIAFVPCVLVLVWVLQTRIRKLVYRILGIKHPDFHSRASLNAAGGAGTVSYGFGEHPNAALAEMDDDERAQEAAENQEDDEEQLVEMGALPRDAMTSTGLATQGGQSEV